MHESYQYQKLSALHSLIAFSDCFFAPAPAPAPAARAVGGGGASDRAGGALRVHAAGEGARPNGRCLPPILPFPVIYIRSSDELALCLLAAGAIPDRRQGANHAQQQYHDSDDADADSEC